MFAKFFTSYDRQNYNKKSEAINIILTPEEKAELDAGLKYASLHIESAKKFLHGFKKYTPYVPNGEDKMFPDGAFNTVIFHEYFLKTATDLICLIMEVGRILKKESELVKSLNGFVDAVHAQHKTTDELIEKYEQQIKEYHAKDLYYNETIDALKTLNKSYKKRIAELENNQKPDNNG